VQEGAARLVADRDLTAERLADELTKLCAGRGALLAMAERARASARVGAATELADACDLQARRAA
jgi:UDP-N-acetylglucosamine:LPS N-acetylglucosamine transferase